MTWLRGRLHDVATVRGIAVAFLACVWLTAMFGARNAYLSELLERPMPPLRSVCALGAETRTPDGLCFYGPATIDRLAASYGAAGRAFYVTTELTLDVLFPVAYALFLALALTFAVSRAFAAGSPMQRLPLLLPLLAAVGDLSENVSIAVLFTVYPQSVPLVPWINVIANAVKWSALYAAVIVLALAVSRWAFRPPPAAVARR